MYTTNIHPESEVRGSLPLINSGKEFINSKLSMTKDKGRMFVIYTVMAVVHMIYTMMKSYWYLLSYTIQQKPVTMFSTHCISLPSDPAAF